MSPIAQSIRCKKGLGGGVFGSVDLSGGGGQVDYERTELET